MNGSSNPSAHQLLDHQNFRRHMFALTSTVAGGIMATHLLIVLQDHKITILTALALTVVAIAYYLQTYRSRIVFRRVRHGSFLAHLSGYVIVVGSFYLHPGYLLASNQRDLIDANWYGPLFGMGIFWGLGLATHAAGTLLTKGFEDVQI